MMFDLVPFENPGRSLSRFWNDFDRDFFSRRSDLFRTDVIDRGDKFVLQAELPGFQRDQIHVDVENNRLLIRAERGEEKEEKKTEYLYRERSWGSYVRSFDLSSVQTDQISAEYKDGVLEITLPKAEKAEPQKKQIKIK